MDEEIEIKKNEKINLINYLIKKGKVLNISNELNTSNAFLQNSESDTDPENSWWYDKDEKEFNQKAHAIIHFLSINKCSSINKTMDSIKNAGLALWIYCATGCKNEEFEKELLKTINSEKYNNGICWLQKYNISKDSLNNIFISENKNQIPFEDILIILDYLKLYFNCPNNFSTEDGVPDYSHYNVHILDNIYNWYLKNINSFSQTNECCKKLEESINEMISILKTNNRIREIKKRSIICTILKVKEVINKLKIRYYDPNRGEFTDIEKENLKKIIHDIKENDTIKF